MLRICMPATSQEDAVAAIADVANLAAKTQPNDSTEDYAFVLYDVGGKGTECSCSLQMVEVHNQSECVWCSSTDQVLNSMQAVSGLDEDIRSTIAASAASPADEVQRRAWRPEGIINARVFTRQPSLLGFVLRRVTDQHESLSGSDRSRDSRPMAIRLEARPSGGKPTDGLLAAMQQLQDEGLHVAGMATVLVQGVDALDRGKYANYASLVMVFLSDRLIISFFELPTTQLVMKELSASSQQFALDVGSGVSTYAQEAVQRALQK